MVGNRERESNFPKNTPDFPTIFWFARDGYWDSKSYILPIQ